MTHLRTRLTKALRRELVNIGVSVPDWEGDQEQEMISDALADVLLSLPGIAIVDLKPPDDEGEWDGQDDRVGWWVANGPSMKDGLPGVLPHVMGNWLHPNAARRFAAALLAAANAAEADQ